MCNQQKDHAQRWLDGQIQLFMRSSVHPRSNLQEPALAFANLVDSTLMGLYTDCDQGLRAELFDHFGNALDEPIVLDAPRARPTLARTSDGRFTNTMRRNLSYPVLALLLAFSCEMSAESRTSSCWIEQTNLRQLKNVIEVFAASRGYYPDSIEDLVVAGEIEPVEMVGRWGQKYVYRKLPEGYELFSSGPDRKPNTRDDIYPDVPWETCKESCGCNAMLMDCGR